MFFFRLLLTSTSTFRSMTTLVPEHRRHFAQRCGGGGREGYLSAQLMHERLQKVVVFPVDTEEDHAG